MQIELKNCQLLKDIKFFSLSTRCSPKPNLALESSSLWKCALDVNIFERCQYFAITSCSRVPCTWTNKTFFWSWDDCPSFRRTPINQTEILLLQYIDTWFNVLVLLNILSNFQNPIFLWCDCQSSQIYLQLNVMYVRHSLQFWMQLFETLRYKDDILI